MQAARQATLVLTFYFDTFRPKQRHHGRLDGPKPCDVVLVAARGHGVRIAERVACSETSWGSREGSWRNGFDIQMQLR
jgi:hypothetical protein